MLVFIWLYPVFAFCISVIMIDLARAFKKNGNRIWIVLLFFVAILVTGILFWFINRGDLNAQKWAKEWALH
jgi:hypothetical protein